MIEQVVIRPMAVQDVVNAALWYKKQSPGLSADLVDEIVRAIQRAKADPKLFPIVRAKDQMRRVLTSRFPYRIFFTTEEKTLFVHAVLHGARHDRHWKQR